MPKEKDRNNLLQLKGALQTWNPDHGAPPGIPNDAVVTAEHMRQLAADLRAEKSFWEQENAPCNPLVTAYYKTVVPKSSRIATLFKVPGSYVSESIAGARFKDAPTAPKHVITYSIRLGTLGDAIALLEECARLVDLHYGGAIGRRQFDDIDGDVVRSSRLRLTKTQIKGCLHDAHYVARFGREETTELFDDVVIVNLYDTGPEVWKALEGIGVAVSPRRRVGNTVQLLPPEYAKVVRRFPYLVSMSVTDISQLDLELPDAPTYEMPRCQTHPSNEPVVGVIDTPFAQDSYYSEWVETDNSRLEQALRDTGQSIEAEDFDHGTAVTSLIVGGPDVNPELEDGCGRFRVRHFGVSKRDQISSFALMRAIESIVRANRDIKVWNLCLGSPRVVSPNFISPEAALLDELQSKYDDIVFVVAGTNRAGSGGAETVGAPADSVNSLVVNATDRTGKCASYSRRGPILTMLHKPDVACFGGDKDDPMHVCQALGEARNSGTSFAAPWITRKMAYLMQVMHLPREVAKALIVDSAAGWELSPDDVHGYGSVPVHIEGVLKANKDEIRFFITGRVGDAKTYNYNLPVPVVNDRHPYMARATLCYFPSCRRNQGVDYAQTELDLHFGRVTGKAGSPLNELNGNKQGESGAYVREGEARKLYGKWDNIKHVVDRLTVGLSRRKAYRDGLWGFSIRKTTRHERHAEPSVPFGLVITLRELTGANRIDTFVQLCSLRGWLVNEIDVQVQQEIYEEAETDIDFDE